MWVGEYFFWWQEYRGWDVSRREARRRNISLVESRRTAKRDKSANWCKATFVPGCVRFVLDEGILMLLLLVDARPLSCQAASLPYLIGAWREVNSSLMADFSIKLWKDTSAEKVFFVKKSILRENKIQQKTSAMLSFQRIKTETAISIMLSFQKKKKTETHS